MAMDQQEIKTVYMVYWTNSTAHSGSSNINVFYSIEQVKNWLTIMNSQFFKITVRDIQKLTGTIESVQPIRKEVKTISTYEYDWLGALDEQEQTAKGMGRDTEIKR